MWAVRGGWVLVCVGGWEGRRRENVLVGRELKNGVGLYYQRVICTARDPDLSLVSALTIKNMVGIGV